MLLLLLLTNLHAYYHFRDRIIGYYLCTQVGGLLYITAYRSFFKVLFPAPVFSLAVLPTGNCYGYTLNNLLMHLSVALLLVGIGQMSRSYLQTRTHLPRLDAGLRYALTSYLAFTALVAVVNLGGFHLDNYTLLYDNLLVVCMLAVLLATAIGAYRCRLPAARAYVVATVVPLLFIRVWHFIT